MRNVRLIARYLSAVARLSRFVFTPSHDIMVHELSIFTARVRASRIMWTAEDRTRRSARP